MKAIFLCERSDRIFQVFDEDICEKLHALTGIEKKLYTKADILNAPRQFVDVEMIFSTWGMPVFTVEEIKTYLPALKSVFYGAGTVQFFARPFLECGVQVVSAWAANAVPVAEMTVAQIIMANKGFFQTDRICREEGRRRAREAFGEFKGNYGESVGIIGTGMIGRLVIDMLKAYNLKVLAYSRSLTEEKARQLGVEKCTLPELFERCFVVSNHLADNEQTKRMLHYDLFVKMRPNATFINTGRGAQVVEEDLVRILQERHDLTALLDVTDPEPPVEGHPFYTLSNCILTPHIAGSAGDEVARMGLYMLRECENYLAGRPCQYAVTEKMLETMA